MVIIWLVRPLTPFPWSSGDHHVLLPFSQTFSLTRALHALGYFSLMPSLFFAALAEACSICLYPLELACIRHAVGMFSTFLAFKNGSPQTSIRYATNSKMTMASTLLTWARLM